MINIQDKTVGEVVAENIKTAHIFKKHGIDFCCGGGTLIKDVCLKKNVDYAQIQQEIADLEKQVSEAENFNAWELDRLIDYIIDVHHEYVLDALPLLVDYSQRVASVHGHHYKETIEINKIIFALAEELNAHMGKEETVLFPYIKKLVTAWKNDIKVEVPHFGSVKNPVLVMENEHETAGELLKQIAQLSNNYTLPAEACNTFRALYSILEEFEQDLHQHIHLENNILFPKAIALERSFRS
ncbi:iron-sulfur cluster repair di-iron protein [Fulvivirgaceae bacterium BMA10]|uniref:Iron-sulfur cluster repair di-iron protein n=1 Tax=Splendidivirga corallicola TaxID=3051826 RepID=A0ABT8KGA8_9BACT|nr:iron-sulfur cluster repair di-iron protein [Fulvivirgaceae bacterium BMA10]